MKKNLFTPIKRTRYSFICAGLALAISTCISSAFAQTGPAGYTFCANERATCNFSGTRQVAYGANGKFNYKSATASIACTNATFGDPVRGVVKACYYANSQPGSSSSSSSSSSSLSSSSSSSLSSSSSGGSANSIVLQERLAGFCGVDGTVDSNNAGFTGSGFANTDNATNKSITWQVNSTGSNQAILEFRFANGGGTSRPGNLLINNGSSGAYSISLGNTGAWNNWGTERVTVDLVQGSNSIKLTSTTAGGLANVDSLTINGVGVSAASCATSSSSMSSSSSSSSVSSSFSSTSSSSSSSSSPGIVASYKPRVIVTTDGEIDDRSSMVRFLMYTSDMDVVGIVQVNSKFQKSGHSVDKWIEKEIDLYEQVLPTLRVHNPNYPDASYLRSIIRVGNENSADLNRVPPDMSTKNTAGERLIIEKLLDDDPRPLHVMSWGGANTTASALWRLKTEYSQAEFQKAASKIRIYCIWYQDGGGQWIEDNIKEALINEAYRWDNVWDYQSLTGPSPDEVKKYMTEEWLNTNVKKNHGPLGAYTPQKYVSEGDTPAFLHMVDNGLEAHTDYTLGGWGGRSIVDPSDPVGKPRHLTDATISDDGDRNKMYWRWVIDAENDFAARMDWGVTPRYSDANHQPVAKVVGGNIRTVAPGQTIVLDATGTTDPDGDSLSYLWWQYHDVDSANTKLTISNNTLISGARFTVPNEPGKQLHIILEVKDDGSPTLKGYQRIIFNIN